jgi:hypothetical protein
LLTAYHFYKTNEKRGDFSPGAPGAGAATARGGEKYFN